MGENMISNFGKTDSFVSDLAQHNTPVVLEGIRNVWKSRLLHPGDIFVKSIKDSEGKKFVKRYKIMVPDAKFPTTRIKVDEETYSAVEIIREFQNVANKVEEFHNINITESIVENWGNYNGETLIEKYEKAMDEYFDLHNWSKELIAISDGYNDTLKDELAQKKQIVMRASRHMFNSMRIFLNERYFSYSHSVKDLSTIDGVQYFEWANDSSRFFTKTFDNALRSIDKRLGEYQDHEIEENI